MPSIVPAIEQTFINTCWTVWLLISIDQSYRSTQLILQQIKFKYLG